MLSTLPGITKLQRMSIYADDVVLLFKPQHKELNRVKRIMDLFGEASGLRINCSKSSVIMIRGCAEDEERAASILGCPIGTFLCKYLGILLALRQLTKNEWQLLLDSIMKCAPPWQRGLITGAGRLVLVDSVLTPRPTHHLLISDAPK